MLSPAWHCPVTLAQLGWEQDRARLPLCPSSTQGGSQPPPNTFPHLQSRTQQRDLLESKTQLWAP